MRLAFQRVATLICAIGLIVACDSRNSTSPLNGGGSSGGGGTTLPGQRGPDRTLPTIAIDTPLTGQLVNIGDSLLVTVRLHDNAALRSLDVVGLTVKGSANLGTLTRTIRYSAITVPANQDFRPNLRDTTIRRYLQPATPVDTTIDSLMVFAIATDTAGNVDTVSKRVNIVAGPKVTVLTPIGGDSVPAGVALTLSVRATHPDGVGSISIHVYGEAFWPTRLDTTLTQAYVSNNRDVTYTTTLRIPQDASLRSRITIQASALDINRQPGSAAPVVVFVRASQTSVPRVTQVVPPRVELLDSITVNATGDGIKTVGFLVEDSTGALIKRDSVSLPQPYTSNSQSRLALNLAQNQQGKRVTITSFAWDQNNKLGYSVKTGSLVPVSTLAAAWSDTSLVVYGRTYPLPRNGSIGDIAVDPLRGNVFLSNTSYNLLEVWQSQQRSFAASGIAVGSQPWGLFVGRTGDTLLVGNSGATTISRVFIGSTDATQIHEALTRRIRTRNTYIFLVTFQRDATTGKIRLTGEGPFSYSDRPQYVAESMGGRIFYSTRPTTSAPAGTIRWMDPALPVPDPRQIWQYGTRTATTTSVIKYAIFNVDSIGIVPIPADAPGNDTLYVYDHPYGQATGTIVVNGSLPVNVIAQAVAGGSDAEIVDGLDIASLSLTDTTFVAASGDRTWIGFGEGDTQGKPGRVVMVNDPSGPVPPFISPLVTTQDIMDNANERIFGISIDSTGLQIGSHGLNSYFAAIDNPFHLRLEGTYDSFDNGAGIAFHPGAMSVNSTNDARVAFVATTSGEIEIVDVAYFINRGHLITKAGLYGSLRASRALPGDPPGTVMKLFGLSANGLVVIDLTAADIKPGP
jgi:hypothetical protein